MGTDLPEQRLRDRLLEGRPMTDATAFTDHRDRKKLADRGKSSEKAIQTCFERMQEKLGVGFAWERVPDARAAGGRFKPVAGDFRAFWGGKSANLEVKEVKDSGHRLPKKNFSRDKIARCYRLSLTGVVTNVIIHHVSTGRWVVMPIWRFFENDLPSWSTTGFPSFDSAENALAFSLQALFND
jgi:hypothetical protein